MQQSWLKGYITIKKTLALGANNILHPHIKLRRGKPVFSLNFSSAGKRPFLTGEAKKNMPEVPFPGKEVG